MSYLGPATERQKDVLRKILDPSERFRIETMTKREAHYIISDHSENWRTEPPTDKQKQFLINRNLWRDDMLRGEAVALIGRVIEQDQAGKKQEESDEPYRWGFLIPGWPTAEGN
jgi:hypothetical protein